MKLPRSWCSSNKVHRGDYLVCRWTAEDELIITTWEAEVRDAKRTNDGENK